MPDSEVKVPERPTPQGGDYRPHYRKREADAYMSALEQERDQLRASHAELMKAAAKADAIFERFKYEVGIGNIGRVRLILQQAIKTGSEVQAGNGSNENG